jgi:hypothetical protein
MALLALLSGCSLPEGRYACAANEDCPSGWHCRLNHLCYSQPATPGSYCRSEDAECDDGSPCTGTFRCVLNVCVKGPEVRCPAPRDCYESLCMNVEGPPTVSVCVERIIDRDGDGEASTDLGACGTDCNDDNGAIKSMAHEVCGDMVDNDCDGGANDNLLNAYFIDCDGDGYAPTGFDTTMSCGEPERCGTTDLGNRCGCTMREPTNISNTDCHDYLSGVHPGLTDYTATRVTGGIGFDINCNGAETQEITCVNVPISAPCPMLCQQSFTCPTCCSMGPGVSGGWIGGTAPECGDTTPAWYTYCHEEGTSCVRVMDSRVQRCR